MSAHLMPELEAITSAIDLLQPLSPDARSRVLSWLDDYFKHHNSVEATSIPDDNVNIASSDESLDETLVEDVETPTEDFSSESDSYEDAGPAEANEDSVDDTYEETFDSFEQFYDYVAPKTARQKVATAGWWLEFEEGQSSWRTFDVTKALKSIGKPLRYLSTTITQEKKKDDPLIEQLSKDGDSAQAHGTFRLSEFGRAFVEGHLPEDYLAPTSASQFQEDEADDSYLADEETVDASDSQSDQDDFDEFDEF